MAIKTPTTDLYEATLQAGFRAINKKFFRSQLPSPVFTFVRKARMRGYLASARWTDGKTLVAELALNPAEISGEPPVDTLATLAHEACHLWQVYRNEMPRNGYHDKAWGKEMRRIGLIPSNTARRAGKRRASK